MADEAFEEMEETIFDDTEDDLEENGEDVDFEETEEFDSDDENDGSDDEISEEELDHIADTAIEALQSILKHFDVGEVTIDEYDGDEGELILDITGNDLAVLIGRHGKTLDALQLIVSAITVREIGYRYPIVIDVEGYKSRQRQKLENIARSTANRVAHQHRSIGLRPMTPYERRIVHIALRDDKRVTTESEGEGGDRHVVIFPVK